MISRRIEGRPLQIIELKPRLSHLSAAARPVFTRRPKCRAISRPKNCNQERMVIAPGIAAMILKGEKKATQHGFFGMRP